jgi:glutamate formiminotransferase
VLACVVNISEGRRLAVIDAVAAAGGACLVDVHRDGDHHRSVLTLAGTDHEVHDAVRAVAERSVELIDLRHHRGAHPRLGALDVVPFVPLGADGAPLADVAALGPALEARDAFARWAGATLALPCFLYGPERSLPEVRRRAFRDLAPDAGPPHPHPRAGASAVGARGPLLAYNLWLRSPDLTLARAVAARLRGPLVRALGLGLSTGVQVSCNLLAPQTLGPATVYDEVARLMAEEDPANGVARAELVGLAPRAVVEAVAPHRWAELGLDPDDTLEARLAR